MRRLSGDLPAPDPTAIRSDDDRIRRPWLGDSGDVIDAAAMYAATQSSGASIDDEAKCATCADRRYVKTRRMVIACPACTVMPDVGVVALRCGFDPARTFATWKRARDTEAMLDAAMAVVQGRQWCAFLRSDVGTGKTHLANAVGVDVIGAGGRARFWESVALMEALRSTQGEGAEQRLADFLEAHVYSYDLLVLDDMGAERPTPFQLEQTFAVVNHYYRNRESKRIVVTSNVGREDDSAFFEQRVLDRLSPHTVEAWSARSRRAEFDR